MAKTSRPHPENLDDINSLDITGDIVDKVKELAIDIEDEVSNRASLDQMIDRLTKLRYGHRTRKTKPWLGASNLSIPQIDTDIAKLKPAYINLLSVDPPVSFEPYGPEDVAPSRKREQLFAWRLKHKVNMFKAYNYGVDQILGPPGQTVFRVIWKHSTRGYTEVVEIDDFPQQVVEALFDPRVDDKMLFNIIQEQYRVDLDYEENIEAIEQAVAKFREGERRIEIDLLETKDDQPEVTACHPYKDLVVPLETKDIQEARFIDYKFWMRKNDVKIAMEDNKYITYSDEDLQALTGRENSRTATGVSNRFEHQFNTDDLILMHETCCWYDINDDGIDEKCIATWPDANPSKILRFIELPYDHGEWPYRQVKRELTEDGFYATRGIPALEQDFQVAISKSINQSIDNGTLLNTPERVAERNVLSNPNNRRFIPGELTIINGRLSQYETRMTVNTSQPALFQQAQFLKSWVDSRLAQQTTGFNSTDLPGQGQQGKKTKAEIDAITFDRGEAKSLDLIVFQEQMKGVYHQIDALYDQFGPEEETILITGNKPQTISRQEIQGKFNMVPNGNISNNSPQARLSKAMFAANVGTGNPFIKQKELIQEILNNLDPRMAAVLLKSDEEIAQEQQMEAQAVAKAKQEQIQTQVGLKKVSDDLDIRKEAILTPIQGRKFAPQ